MQVINTIKDYCISVDELRERLENKEGILAWVDGTGDLKLIKSSYKFDEEKKYRYGWETLFFNRGLDCPEMEIYTLEQLIHFIKETLMKALGTIFWFPNEEEFIDWLVKEYKYILDRS